MSLGDGVLWSTVLILLAGTANAEIFACQAGSHWEENGDIAVTASIDPPTGAAYVSAAGRTYVAAYSVHGFDRRWDFVQNDEGKFNYAFEIKADGSALYYDFTVLDKGGPAGNALQLFVCKLTK